MTPVAPPRLPAVLEPFAAGEPLTDESTYRRVALRGVDLGGAHAEAVEFLECRFERASLAGTRLEFLVVKDCVVERSDWANLHATRSGMTRVRLADVRLTGLHWIDGTLRDVALTGCRLDAAVFRQTRLRNVSFVDCGLSGVDFTEADLRGARFVGCLLAGAQFARADCAGAEFVDCDLDGVGSVASLRGATVATNDVAALAAVLARALDITLRLS